MLTDEQRRNAGRLMVLELMQATESITCSEMAGRVGVSMSMPSQWMMRNSVKSHPVGIAARTIDKILKRIPTDRITPELQARLYRLAARTCGYEI